MPILIEASASVTCVILALLAMSFTMFWNTVSLTLIGKSFNHISKGKLLTALPMQNVFNDTNFRRLRRLCNFLKIVTDTFRSRPR